MEQENPGQCRQGLSKGETPTDGVSHGLWWAEASIWTDRMVSALGQTASKGANGSA